MIAPFLLLLAGPLVREAPADRDGWTRVVLEGTPSEIGRRHGELLAPKIRTALVAVQQGTVQSTGRSWTWFRTEAKKLFWEGLDSELKAEIEGIAQGSKIPVDDILALNAHIELEGSYHPWLRGRESTRLACSAFVATGSATKDGEPVMGHNFWWSWTVGTKFDTILDIRPEKGHRIVMIAMPGTIHSGTDWAITGAGLAVCETTIANFKGYDPEGVPEFARMRLATQHAKTIDEWVARMRQGNNGGYANAWLLFDAKTKEIAKLELGLKHVTLERTKDGAYVGANFPENPDLIREETVGWDPDPRRNACEARRVRWNDLMLTHAGKIDGDLARAFVADTVDGVTGKKGATDRTLCGRSPWGGASHAAVATAADVREMRFFARRGAPDGGTIPGVGVHPWSTVE